MNSHERQVREELMTQILRARTLSEVAQATQALTCWMQDYPEDQGMRDGFEHLSLRQDIAEEKEAGQFASPPEPAAVGQAA